MLVKPFRNPVKLIRDNFGAHFSEEHTDMTVAQQEVDVILQEMIDHITSHIRAKKKAPYSSKEYLDRCRMLKRKLNTLERVIEEYMVKLKE